MARAERFTPTRAGIINLWDYRDEEFVFVDGWLVLRGPNGSGKTKALEVLFPFLLDGRIEPRRLNPFASEDRTMKSNVLYRGQEQSHAYVWMEFHRPDSGEYVTIGIGLRAQKYADKVTRHHFVTDGRVGRDFSLIDAGDRPLNRRDLLAALGPERVFDSTEDYRHAIDARLFGLGPARYEQLLDLVLTLRKPQLAKDLNPVELSRTLQRGLRPLDDALIVEAAGSFDDMEAVAATLEGLVAADRATTAFLSIYSTYLRTHARAAADAVTARRAAIVDSQQAVARATAEDAAAERARDDAEDALRKGEGEPDRLREHLDRLKSSSAYRSHEQLADLKRHVQTLADAAERAVAEAAREQRARADRQADLARAEKDAADSAAQVARLLRTVTDEAEEAGLPWSPPDNDSTGFAVRAKARVTQRRDDIQVVRRAVALVERAELDHGRAAEAATDAAGATERAVEAERTAESVVLGAREAVRSAVSVWAARHEAILTEIAPPETAERLALAVEHLGLAEQPTLKEVLSEATAAGLARIQRETATIEAERATVDGRRTDAVEEYQRIAAEHDDAPVAWPTRTADRSHRPGAPLWALVRFADGVGEATAAAVEAALEAGGLLDAWLHPDPKGTAAALSMADADGYLLPLAAGDRPSGRTLADLLVAEAQEHVPAAAIEAVLASVAVGDRLDGDSPQSTVVTATGQYAYGILVGQAAKAAPEYIGATARAARRAARLAECELAIARLTEHIAALDASRAGLLTLLAGAETARSELPSADRVHAALQELTRALNTVKLCRETQARAAATLDRALAERATAAAALRRATAEHNLPTDRLEAITEAVRRFESAAEAVGPARTAAAKATDAREAAVARHQEATDRWEEKVEQAQAAAVHHEHETEALRTLTAAIDDADVHKILADVAATQVHISEAETALKLLRERRTRAEREQAQAAERVSSAHRELLAACAEAHRDAVRLQPFADADLLGILRCPTDLRWPAYAIDDHAEDLPTEVTALHEAILDATKDLAPTENSLKQSSTRLNSAYAELQAQLPAAGLDHRPELDIGRGIMVVRVADEQGLTPVAYFADRIARERQEQEQLLSDAERRILEDALLTQLARQIHQRTVESRDLVNAMDSQMRARRMSSGLTVGVGWHLADDLDAEQREACGLLDKDAARLTAAQLTTLRRHFANRIKAARAMSPDQPYRELLDQVLDYRKWRTFKFTLHRPGAVTEQLTKGRHSQLSGGEQSVSLHLPLFAAANALFGSARPTAPRLLGLDEAFAGVDDNGRGELMSLATEFDLDLFMTGYDLWATHSAVPGAAHYDLSHSAAEHTVAMILLVWNGSEIAADFDGTLARACGSPETRRIPGPTADAAQTGLLSMEPM
jgi:uncharacterized protein (TIGR02680 family)